MEVTAGGRVSHKSRLHSGVYEAKVIKKKRNLTQNIKPDCDKGIQQKNKEGSFQSQLLLVQLVWQENVMLSFFMLLFYYFLLCKGQILILPIKTVKIILKTVEAKSVHSSMYCM